MYNNYRLEHLPKHRISARRMLGGKQRLRRTGSEQGTSIENDGILVAITLENNQLTSRNEFGEKTINFYETNKALVQILRDTELNEEKCINIIPSIHQQFELFHEIQSSEEKLPDTQLGQLFGLLTMPYKFLAEGERNQYLPYLQEAIDLFKKFDGSELSEAAMRFIQSFKKMLYINAVKQHTQAKQAYLNKEYLRAIRLLTGTTNLFHSLGNNEYQMKSIADKVLCLKACFNALCVKQLLELKEKIAIANEIINEFTAAETVLQKCGKKNAAESIKAHIGIYETKITSLEVERKELAAKKLQKFFRSGHALGLSNKRTMTFEHDSSQKRIRLG